MTGRPGSVGPASAPPPIRGRRACARAAGSATAAGVVASCESLRPPATTTGAAPGRAGGERRGPTSPLPLPLRTRRAVALRPARPAGPRAQTPRVATDQFVGGIRAAATTTCRAASRLLAAPRRRSSPVAGAARRTTPPRTRRRAKTAGVVVPRGRDRAGTAPRETSPRVRRRAGRRERRGPPPRTGRGAAAEDIASADATAAAQAAVGDVAADETPGGRDDRGPSPRKEDAASADATGGRGRTDRLSGGREGTALGGCGGRRLRGCGCSEGGGVSRRSTAVDETTGRPQPCPRGRGAARRAQRTSPWRGRADGGGRCERGHATVAADTTLPRPRGTAKRVQWRMRPREEETAVRPGWRPSGRTCTRGRPGRVRGHWQ